MDDPDQLKEDEEYKTEDIVAFLTSSDGYLRVFSIKRKKLIFSFFYSFGGLTTFDLSPDRSHILLSIENESVILINMLTKYAISFEMHDNFVSFATFFQKINTDLKEKNPFKDDWKDTYRIITASLDGYIGILDINWKHYTDKKSENPELLNLEKSEILNLETHKKYVSS